MLIDNFAISSIAAVFSVFMSFFGIIGIGLFILNGMGIYNMSKKLGLSTPWLAFIPVVSEYAFGRVSEKYVMNNGRKSARFSNILLVLNIIMFVSVIVLITGLFSFGFSFIYEYAKTGHIRSDFVPNISSVAAIVFSAFICYCVSIAYLVVKFVAAWRLYSLFDFRNATLYLVLAVFFSFLLPIFVFALRNKEPAPTYDQRMGQYTNNY